MEPAASVASLGTKALSVIKDLPLWLLTGIAVSLTSFLSIPEFRGAVSEKTQTWIAVAAITFAIFAACRFASVSISKIEAYRAGQQAHRTFHLTPITHQCYWGVVRQKDGTVVMQTRTEFVAKNLTDKILHLLTARPVWPKIRGEILQVLIHTGAGSKYGLDCLPPRATLPTSIMIMIRGLPASFRGKTMPLLRAVLAVTDDERNEQRVRMSLKPMTAELDTVAAD
jgi:hypothetical protein